MDLIILESARKHQGQGFDDDDIRHAEQHARDAFRLTNPDPDERSWMVIGPTVDGSTLLEVGVTIDDEAHRWAFHAMKARPKWLR